MAREGRSTRYTGLTSETASRLWIVPARVEAEVTMGTTF